MAQKRDVIDRLRQAKYADVADAHGFSDAHRGLVNAIAAVFQRSSWQRCRVHVMRNVLATVNKGHDEMVGGRCATPNQAVNNLPGRYS